MKIDKTTRKLEPFDLMDTGDTILPYPRRYLLAIENGKWTYPLPARFKTSKTAKRVGLA